MSPDEAPVGTVCVVGHPDNGATATKQDDGRWLYNDNQTCGFSRRAVDYDTIYKGVSAVYIPGRTL